MKKLLIVESPAKSRTIKRYLGADFEVLASYGHVRDLLPKEGAVDPDHDFAMKYEIIEKNSKHVDAIARAAKKSDALYLATDPDREGEAIAWHLTQLLESKNLLVDKPVRRVVFHEITKAAINEAIEHPRTLSQELVDAQQARRALDYLVGFKLSPLLWKKIQRGLSAGRVQSPALRMIVEREDEIEKFETREYWTIEADAEHDQQAFGAKLIQYQGEKIEQFSVINGEQAGAIRSALLKAAKGHLAVAKVDKKQRRRNPAAPFITSTLQQEAVRKLGFTAQRAMRTAQQLYEGVDIGSGSIGLITYMRTDSCHFAQEAVTELREFIAKQYGKDKLPEAPRVYKTKAKNAQEAHEAIRPTSVQRSPNLLKEHLTADQFKLYDLIWKRTVACQMTHATIDTVAVDLACGAGNTFRANGSTVVDPGFMLVYREGVDEEKTETDESFLPIMSVGDRVTLLGVRDQQHFTEPPPRYTEASLIKALEEYGIGRPSTYAAIISTLQERKYAELENKRFRPTDVARVVNKFLTQHFANYVDYHFTARLEDDLDAIARGEKTWLPVMREFWTAFKQLLDLKEETVKREDVTQEKLDEDCPKCGKPLSARLGRRGRFIGCTGYPECDYTRNLDGKEKSAAPELEIVAGRECPQCASHLVVREGPYGRFIGCSSYPKCKFLEPLDNQPTTTGVECPECKKGSLMQRRSRRGKVFFSCSEYPKCSYATWNEPIAMTCPSCQWPVLTIKTTKRKGTELVCPQKECGFAEPYEQTDPDQSAPPRALAS